MNFATLYDYDESGYWCCISYRQPPPRGQEQDKAWSLGYTDSMAGTKKTLIQFNKYWETHNGNDKPTTRTMVRPKKKRSTRPKAAKTHQPRGTLRQLQHAQTAESLRSLRRVQ